MLFVVVFDLLYWRDIKKTGAIFASSLSLLLSLALCSIISVIAYFSLIVLTITVSFRLYKTAMGAVQKNGDEHPFKLVCND
jgi:Reticulon